MIANDSCDAHYLKADFLLITALLRVAAGEDGLSIDVWSDAR
jgi:hypothetical protein